MLSVLGGPFPFVSSGFSSSYFLERAQGFSQVLIHSSIAKCMSFYVLMQSCCVPFMVFPHYRWESVNTGISEDVLSNSCPVLEDMASQKSQPQFLSVNSYLVVFFCFRPVLQQLQQCLLEQLHWYLLVQQAAYCTLHHDNSTGVPLHTRLTVAVKQTKICTKFS